MKTRLKLFFPYLYSLLFCLRYLPLRQAVYIPVLIHPSVRIKGLGRGAISFCGQLKHSMLIFGFPGTIGTSNCQSLISISRGGRLIVSDGVNMARGTRIVIGTKGQMSIGRHFWCNSDCFFNCTTKITIGENNMYGWSINFNTNDGHHVYESGKQKPMEGDIVIGNHVWIASYCHITKNTLVADNCVVAQCSVVTKRHDISNCLIGGIPAKVIKRDFSWKA